MIKSREQGGIQSGAKHDHEYKVQAVKLAKDIGGAKADKELGIPDDTGKIWSLIH